MRKICTLCILITYLSFSQNKQILYGFSEIPQSLMLNPGGKVQNNGYFGMPLLSHIHAHIGSSGATVYDVFANDRKDFNAKLKNALYSMKNTDFFSVNQQLEIFSGGFAYGRGFDKNKYLSFGLYQELDLIAYFPRDNAILAYEGNQSNINRQFDVGDLNGKAEVVSVFHVGYNKKVNENFTFGLRGKIYSSIINFSSVKNNGTFITLPGENNIYRHIFNLDLELKTSGLASLREDGSDYKSVTKDIKKRVLFSENLGLGFDVGFTHKLTDQWTLDASLLDIGFIGHSKDIENYNIEGTYTFEGINPIFPETGTGQTADEYWSDIEKNFKDLFTIDTTKAKYTTWRPVKLNASINYTFGKKTTKECNCIQDESGYLNAAGMQIYAINRPKQPQLAVTAYYYRLLFNGLRAKATYTMDSYSLNNFGLGISAHFKNVNFYVMADNFFEFQNLYNAQSVSLQLGFNYIFNKNED